MNVFIVAQEALYGMPISILRNTDMTLGESFTRVIVSIAERK